MDTEPRRRTGPQHTETLDYGCFLSDLTGFADVPLYGARRRETP